MIFIDTDILSYFFAGKKIIRDRLSDVIDRGERICLTSINVYEVLKGLKYRSNSSKEEQFQNFLENVTVFTLDAFAVEEASSIYADLRKNGKLCGDADILIAAIVISNNGSLVSNNTKHYMSIKNLRLINWI